MQKRESPGASGAIPIRLRLAKRASQRKRANGQHVRYGSQFLRHAQSLRREVKTYGEFTQNALQSHHKPRRAVRAKRG
jgi:hypothetical protein